jgi:outer membrane protein assembly factor BamB
MPCPARFPAPRDALRYRARTLAFCCLFALGGCGGFFDFLGTREPPPLPGTRIAVLLSEQSATADPRIADLSVRLPRPIENQSWPLQGGFANHAMQHLALGDAPAEAWDVGIGADADDDAPILSGPVVANGRVYAMDADAKVTAFDEITGSRVWERNISPDEEDDGNWGGGVAYENGKVFAATGFAEVVALDAATGKIVWRQSVSGPMRAAPTVFEGRLFAVTKDNRTFALDAETGAVQWSHSGIEEVAGLLGAASPAVEGDTVVVAYSSGEIFALRVENGRELWSDNLAAIRRADAVSALADIIGRPVIDRGRVYAISHSGRMVAIDAVSGRRVWEASLGGTNQPWVAGDFVFVLTNNAEVAAMTARDGLVRWITPIELYEDPEDKTGLIDWTGPVLAGDRLIVAGSNGKALTLSPYTGEIIGEIDLPGNAAIAPAISGKTLYMLTDEARLVAFR